MAHIYICVSNLCQRRFKQWLATCSVPSHYLYQQMNTKLMLQHQHWGSVFNVEMNRFSFKLLCVAMHVSALENDRRDLAAIRVLTQWGLDKMAAIFLTTISNAFSWLIIFEFRLIFHRILLLMVQLTISEHWFIQCLVTEQATSQVSRLQWINKLIKTHRKSLTRKKRITLVL